MAVSAYQASAVGVRDMYVGRRRTSDIASTQDACERTIKRIASFIRFTPNFLKPSISYLESVQLYTLSAVTPLSLRQVQLAMRWIEKDGRFLYISNKDAQGKLVVELVVEGEGPKRTFRLYNKKDVIPPDAKKMMGISKRAMLAMQAHLSSLRESSSESMEEMSMEPGGRSPSAGSLQVVVSPSSGKGDYTVFSSPTSSSKKSSCCYGCRIC